MKYFDFTLFVLLLTSLSFRSIVVGAWDRPTIYMLDAVGDCHMNNDTDTMGSGDDSLKGRIKSQSGSTYLSNTGAWDCTIEVNPDDANASCQFLISYHGGLTLDGACDAAGHDALSIAGDSGDPHVQCGNVDDPDDFDLDSSQATFSMSGPGRGDASAARRGFHLTYTFFCPSRDGDASSCPDDYTLHCDSYRCFPGAYRCDSFPDCIDGSDEHNCDWELRGLQNLLKIGLTALIAIIICGMIMVILAITCICVCGTHLCIRATRTAVGPAARGAPAAQGRGQDVPAIQVYR